MSIHNAPIQTLNQSKSNRSLYTENSQDSQVNTYRKQQLKQNDNHGTTGEELVSHKIGKLPSLIPQQSPEKDKQINMQKIKDANTKQEKQFDGMPSLPVRGTSNRYQNDDGQFAKGIKLGHPHGPQFNTIAVTSLQRNQVRNLYGQMQNPMRLTGMSGTNPMVNQNQRSRMLRSSQGGRWFRSQSLMQDKGKQASSLIYGNNTSTIDLMVRNFHKHQSKCYQQLQNYIKFYSTVQKQLHEKNQLFCKYKVSLSDTLEQVKNKMEVYLQSKIDLSNLPIDRPDSDWGQQQLMKFYTNYNQIMLKKLELPQEQRGQQNKKSVTVLKKYKNCSYYGPVKEGKKHGFGYLHYFSGRFYQGLFQNDQKTYGFEMDDSELYYGQYEKNQRHGEGILKTNQYLITGLFTNGQFKLSQSQQKGGLSSTGFNRPGLRPSDPQTIIYRKGFKVQFSSMSFYTGSTIIVEKNNMGDIFIGLNNEQGQKQGEGLQIFANADLYIGNYEQGAPQGYGQYYWDSGAFYRGEFLSGMRHGKGTWMMVHGDRYDGEYLNDKKNGKGTYVWKSGDRYQGQFENDYRHGYGEMYWRDGTSFKGQWLNGIQINKTFKLGSQGQQKHTQQTGANSGVTKTKNSFKTVQARTRILKKQIINKNTISRNSKAKSSLQTSSQPSRNMQQQSNNKRIPLQKLKAMLNPSNSIN